ncbi:nicotinamide N-methyltransferase-like [Discoglossus pictus]
MASGAHKFYHENLVDVNEVFDRYYSSKKGIIEEIMIYKMKVLHEEFSTGCIKGDTLIDLTAGPIIHHLFAACEFFKDITVLETNEQTMTVMQKWVNKETDALDWSHLSTYHCDLERNRGWEEKEEILRRSIKHIVKFDFTKENPTDPIVLPKADCFLSSNGLDFISKDQTAFCNNLMKISSLLKVGGHLIFFGFFNASFYTVGGHRYHILTYNEEFLRMALEQAGYTIEKLETLKNQITSDLIHFGHFVYVKAVKEREVYTVTHY